MNGREEALANLRTVRRRIPSQETETVALLDRVIKRWENEPTVASLGGPWTGEVMSLAAFDAWYEAELEPRLAELAQQCAERGWPFLAVVGEDGEREVSMLPDEAGKRPGARP